VGTQDVIDAVIKGGKGVNVMRKLSDEGELP